jgi:hypothetical protein
MNTTTLIILNSSNDAPPDVDTSYGPREPVKKLEICEANINTFRLLSQAMLEK